MSRFGVAVREERRNVFIPGGQRYQARKCQVEGDWSNAAFLYAFNAVGGSLKIQGLNERSIQGDRACVTFFKQLAGKCPEREQPIDLSDTPDLGPVLFATAAALKGGFFTGTGRLRIKESDRASVMAEELRKFGVRCIVRKNEVVVLPSMLRKPQVPLNGHNDHRVVMALTIPASLTGGTITGAEAVKSWPEFLKQCNNGVCK